MNRSNFLIGLLMCCAILSGCGDESTHSAILVVESFHNKFNSKDFNGIYTDIVSKEFKKSMTKLDYDALMNKNFTVLGNYQYGRLLKGEQVQALVGENEIKLTYHSIYTNYELNELFVIKKENGKDKIAQIVYDDIHAIKLKNN